MKWFLQFLSLGSAVLYTLLVIIDNRIPNGIADNTAASEAHSNQHSLSAWGPYLPNRSPGQDRQASTATQPTHQQNAAREPKPYRLSPRQYFDDQPTSDNDGARIGKRPAALPITGGSFEPSVPLEGKEAIWFVVSRAARLHAGPSVSSRITHFYPVGTELKLVGYRARLVSSFRSRDIATRMDLREVLSRSDPRSWSDAARSARLAKPHTSCARCTKAEACKPGQETNTPTKNCEITTPAEQKDFAQPQRVRQLDREGVSRVLRKLAVNGTKKAHDRPRLTPLQPEGSELRARYPRGSKMNASNSKAAADKARSKYRKTTRKVGTEKAHGSDRKTASKAVAERAHGTYRKTAARFEEFAYDAQMPKSVRALAETSVAQTRELYVHSLEAVLESSERFVVAAGQGTVALNRKAITSLGAISIPASVSRKGWPERRTLPRLWNCRQPIGASRSANWQLKRRNAHSNH